MIPKLKLDTILNQDCISGMKSIRKNRVDLIVTDPPFGIKFKAKKGNYNRKESLVLDGYQEVSEKNYAQFSTDWITEAYRVLKDTGSMYVFTGYNNMRDILNALHDVGFKLIGNPIWQYPFGVYAFKQFVVSHYNVFYVCKNPKLITFNSDCRFTDSKQRYHDLIDVWNIKREYWQGKEKTPTKLPFEIISKLISYSSNKKDLVLDPFMGSGEVAVVAKHLKRHYIGYEIVKAYHDFAKKRLTSK